MRVGLNENKPWLVASVKGAKAFGTLADALKYFKEKLQGNGVVVVAESNYQAFESPSGEPIKEGFCGAITSKGIVPAGNYRVLLGTPKDWYWEHATGPWSVGGRVVHNQSRFQKHFVIIVVPNAASRSPIPPELLREWIELP